METINKDAVLQLNKVELSIVYFCLYSCCSKILANEIYQKINRINDLLARTETEGNELATYPNARRLQSQGL